MPTVVLVHPQIPQNTGNIIRLCANTNTHLKIVGPTGFQWDDKKLRRAGLDYQEWADIEHLNDWESFLEKYSLRTCWFFTTTGHQAHSSVSYANDDLLVFGSETHGLPKPLLAAAGQEKLVRLPMVEQSRSLNLSNTVAIAVYEAWRQLNFIGARGF
ncbi:MAG: tRNA (uridine(34)/cytosine(34)/5-carboxymethylaminomethyluridine(34)-2'-O)-methyltransferase TrmL [Pseudomonadota bacterium]